MKNFIKLSALVAVLAVANCAEVGEGGGNAGGGETFDSNEFLGIEAATSREVVKVIVSNMPAIDESGSSRAFRIPAILRLNNGKLAYGGDVRWGSTADSAHNIDTAIRIGSADGLTWGEARFVQTFEDYKHHNTTGNSANSSDSQGSASFIDSALVQAENGDLLAITTAFPWGSGLVSSTQKAQNYLTQYVVLDGETYVKLRPKYAWGGADYSNDAKYTMMFNVKGGPVVDREGNKLSTEKLRELLNDSHANNGTFAPVTGGVHVNAQDYSDIESISIDENWIVYTNGIKMQSEQYTVGKTIHGNLTHNNPANYSSTHHTEDPAVMVDVHVFYWNSPVATVGKNFIFMAKSTDNGETWGKPVDISHQFVPGSHFEDTYFYGVSPGVGMRVREGKYKGRMLIALQPVHDGCRMAAIWSDNNGKTWEAGEAVEKYVLHNDGTMLTTTRLSESQFVESADDQIIAFHRTTSSDSQNYVAYSVSPDGGATWETWVAEGLRSTGGTGIMIGATSMRYSSYFGKRMLALSLPGNATRSGGTVQIGYLEESSDEFWTEKGRKIYKPVFPGKNSDGTAADGNFWTHVTPQTADHDYGYSSIEQMENGDLIVAYEYHNSPITANVDDGGRSLDATIIKLNHKVSSDDDENSEEE